jgi:hypothetical protein
MLQYNPSISGSLSVTGSLIVTNGVIGTVNGVDIQIFSSSINQVVTNIQTATGSQDGRLTSIESFTSSVSTTNTFTASAELRLNELETKSASVDGTNTSQTNRLNSLEEKTGSLATTGSNTFYGTQTFSGSVYVKENLIVQGSSSLQNITASAVDIGTNRIILNVDNPSVRYAGISVYDSGSTGGTGSLWWDSVENHWLYEHPSDSAAPYNSAILISGPKNAGNLGEELELVNNFIVKAVGGDHISSSAIYDDGTKVTMYGNTMIISSSGYVGIGTATPSRNLHIVSSGTDTTIAATKNGTDSSQLGVDSVSYMGAGGDLTIRAGGFTSAAERVRIVSDGKVGIGTTNPGNKLHVYGGGILIENNQDIRTKNSSGTQRTLVYMNSSNKVLLVNDDGDIVLSASGNVGIGTTGPEQKLHVNGNLLLGAGTSNDFGERYLEIRGSRGTANTSAATLYLSQIWNGVSYPVIVEAQQGKVFGNAASDLVLKTSYYSCGVNTIERMRITDEGKVGIGTSTPGNILHIYSTPTTGEIRLGGGNGSGNARMFFQSHATTAYIDMYGNSQYLPLQINANPVSFMGGNVNVLTTTNAGMLTIGTSDARKLSFESNNSVRSTSLFKSYSMNGVAETWCRIRLESNYAANFQGVWGTITVAYHPYHASMGRFYQYRFQQSPYGTNNSYMKIATVYEEVFGWDYYGFSSDVQFYNFENYLYIKVIGRYDNINYIRSVRADLTGGNIAMDSVQLETDVSAPARLGLITKNGAAALSA